MKKKTTNTATKETHAEWLMGGNPNAIEAQEARGQKEFVASQQLPKKCNSPRGINAVEQYHKMGIETFTPSKGDPLFIGVNLPKGWEKKETKHSMWNNMVDDKGRTRATIFYKAAFYDRDSFINFETRYNILTRYVSSDTEDSRAKHIVIDNTNPNDPLFESSVGVYVDYDSQRELCVKYLEGAFPNWKDINAYWE